jgi:tRNA(Ile)-lysidine synthase TilS/MesJ
MDVVFRTPHGDFLLNEKPKSPTLFDLLRQNGLPYTAVTAYGYDKSSNSSALFTGLEKSLDDLATEYSRIELRPDRNIDYPSLVQNPRPVADSGSDAAEYPFRDKAVESEVTLQRFTRDECVTIVRESVGAFLTDDIKLADKKIVVGVSGGGDSNTLLDSLLASARVSREQLYPVMIMGVPDWDEGLARAQSLCDAEGIPLRVIPRDEVNRILGRSSPSTDWAADFERAYPEVDAEVIGTLAVRLSLSSVAKEIGAQACITGLNLEDLLSEALLDIISRSSLSKFPVREIDGMPFWFPLYRVPKRIIDGCNPKYSLDNYNDRAPSRLLWRAIPYYLAQQISSLTPGVEFQLLNGLRGLADVLDHQTVFHEELGFSTATRVEPENIERWQRFLAGH